MMTDQLTTFEETFEKTRLDRALAVLDALEQVGSPSDRFSAAFPLLSGFELTGASDEVRDAIESMGLEFNAVAECYSKADSETIPKLGDEDARYLTMHLRHACELARDEETERILARLRDHGSVLPEAEVIEVRRHRDWFIPHLMRECREEIEKLKKLDNIDDGRPDDKDSSVPFFSFYLFSEWHVSDSVPVILESLTLPGEGAFKLFGDAVHEQAARYLAQFLSDDFNRIDALIADSAVDIYVRWAAAGSYKYLVRDQQISTADAVARLDRLFQQTKVVGDDGRPGMGHSYELSAGILEVIHSIGGSTRSAILADERNWEFVDESIIHPDEFGDPSDSAIEELPPKLLNLPPTRVADCLEMLRTWASFMPERVPVPPPTPRERPRPAISQPPAHSLLPSVEKPVKRAERVPRNAKCPCGSGKKYKQCCLRRET